MITATKRQETHLGGELLLIGLGGAVLALDAYALRLVWRWHVAAWTGWPVVGYLHALGLVVVLHVLLSPTDRDEDVYHQRVFRRLVRIAKTWSALLCAWVLS